MNRVFELNSSKMHFIAVYVSEAHASDEWPLGKFVSIPQHKTIEERIVAAKNFVSALNFKLPVYVDTIDNSFDNTYYAWPDRYYIIRNGIMKDYGTAIYALGFDRKKFIEDLQAHGATVPDVEFKPFPSTVPDVDKSISEFNSFHLSIPNPKNETTSLLSDIKNQEGCMIA